MKTLLLTLLLQGWAGAALGQVEIYVSDAGNFNAPPWQILKFDQDGASPEVFIDENLAWPQDIVFLEDSNTVLISNLGSSRINRHDARTGAFIDVFSSNPSQPTRMKVGPDNLLYVLQWSGSGTVQRYRMDGTFVDDFTDTGVSRSIGMDWDADGNLYVASFALKHVRKFDAEGVDQGLFVDSGLNGPTNIWFDDDGDLLVLDWSGGAVRRYDSSGTLAGNFATGLSQPEGLGVLPNGNVLIGNGGEGSVRMYGPDGTFIDTIVPAGAGGLIQPNAVVVRSAAPGSDFRINAGLNDAWYDPAASGQGFYMTVLPDIGQISLAWFTFDTQRPAGSQAVLGGDGQRWLTALGPYEGNAASLVLFQTTGGVFGVADPPTSTAAVGTLEIEFADCRQATIAYEMPALGLAEEIPIQRVVDDNVALCEALQ